MDAGASAMIAFLTARGFPTCATCSGFDPEAQAIDSGVRYCRRLCLWQWPGGGYGCRSYSPQETTTNDQNP